MTNPLHPLAQRLAQDGVLGCPRCGAFHLGSDGAAFVCAACEARFPSYNRVADFYGMASLGSSSNEPDVTAAEGLAQPVARALDLPDTDATIAAVAEVLRRTALMSADHQEFDETRTTFALITTLPTAAALVQPYVVAV